MKLKVGLLLPHWGKLPPQPSPGDSSSALSPVFLASSGLWLTGWVGWALWCSGEWVGRCINPWNEKVRKRKAVLPNGAKMDQEFMQKAGNLWLPRHALDFEDYASGLWSNRSSQLPHIPVPWLQFGILCCRFLILSASTLQMWISLWFRQIPRSCMEDEACLRVL